MFSKIYLVFNLIGVLSISRLLLFEPTGYVNIVRMLSGREQTFSLIDF